MWNKKVIVVLICIAIVAVIVFVKLGSGRRAPERPEAEITPRPVRAQVSPAGVQDSLRTVVAAVRPAGPDPMMIRLRGSLMAGLGYVWTPRFAPRLPGCAAALPHPTTATR